MKKENENLSRRTFLSKGMAVAAVPAIISIETLAAPNSEELTTTANPAMLSGDLVTTTGVQTLTNKTISSRLNTLGTDYVNIKEYELSGTDITRQLNQAIHDLTQPDSYGGQILIPHGVWTSDGGHAIENAISIEGVGFNLNPGYYGTEIRLNSKTERSFMFQIEARSDGDRKNISLKNLAINLQDTPHATGLLMTNAGGGHSICFTGLENVGFNGGKYGIKVDWDSKIGQFECILNRFERLSFIGCHTAFYCNAINGGYEFNNCYFSLPSFPEDERYIPAVAFECVSIGNLAVEHCLFVGNGDSKPNQPVTDGSTILKTEGEYNNISFFDCQDEGIQFTYRNTDNFFDYVPLVFRNCLVQSSLYFTASGSVIFDSCRINITNNGAKVTDTATAYARIYYKGLNNIYWQISQPPSTNFHSFVNANSQVIYEATEIGLPVITPTGTTGDQVINASRGTVNIASGQFYVSVYNNMITPQSLVFAQLRSFDSNGARIRNVYCDYGYFTIYLNQNAVSALSIGFKVEA